MIFKSKHPSVVFLNNDMKALAIKLFYYYFFVFIKFKAFFHRRFSFLTNLWKYLLICESKYLLIYESNYFRLRSGCVKVF